MNIKKKDNLKITIITVCYNSEKTIKTTLGSVANQTFEKIEHLIIDGKSTDKTISIVKEYPHVKKIISEPDKGIYDAMNKGIKIASGDIIGFLNSDDLYINNEVISKVVSEFKKDSLLDACYADLIYVNHVYTSKVVRYFKSSKFKQGLFSKGWCPPHPTFFVRRSIYEQYGNFDLDYHLASDVDLMIRFLEIHEIRSCYIAEPLVRMRMGGATNKNLKNILQQNMEILNSFHKNSLPVNRISFFINKIISRSKQFFRKQS
jgi:glycosyltransferase involved in cell wall biosynthesis